VENLEQSSKTKNPNLLYSQLEKAVPLLVPDRSLSTFGIKNLKEFRCSASKWPLAGVFRFSDIAQRILKKNNLYRQTIDELEAFAYLARQNPNKDLIELKSDFDLALKLRKLGSLENLQKIIINPEAQALLATTTIFALNTLFQLSEYAQEKQQVLHFFEYIEEATSFLQKNPNAQNDFHRFRHDAKQEIFVVGFRELYSSEYLFLKELKKNYKITFQYPEKISFVEHNPIEKNQTLETSSLNDQSHLLWISHLETPGPLEAKVLTEHNTALKVRINPQLRYMNTELQGFLIDFKKESFLKQKEKTNNSDIKNLIDRIAEKGSTKEILLLESLKFFEESKVERPITRNIIKQSPIVFTIEDFPIMNPLETLLWGHQKTWEEYYLNLASENAHLKVPEDIEKALLAEGVIVPSHKKEQKKLKALLSECHSFLKIIQTSQKKDFQVKQEAYSVKAKAQPMLSPSGLENLYRCPLNFHYSRECRIPLVEIPNDIEGSAIKRGVWIHGVLERIDFKNLKSFSRAHLEKILHSELEKAFKDFASPSYIKILQAQVSQLSESMYFYIEKLEKPLQILFPFRKFESEKEIECHWSEELKLKGRVDRLDFIGEGALLWDYKTSNYSGTKYSTLLENGRFQWLLYKEIFAKEGLPIYGGGYLNPLDLKKSRLIFFENTPLPSSFFDSLSEQGIRYEQCKTSEETQMSLRLHEIIKEQIKVWQSPLRKAAPLNSKVCTDCSHKAFCAYPYGVLPC
jgi:hypothetical protein